MMDRILPGIPYVSHNKLVLKFAGAPGIGKHQDSQYWEPLGFLKPDNAASAYIAIDPATNDNGCLKLLAKSHREEPLTHDEGQSGFGGWANKKQLQDIHGDKQVVTCEMDPGDVVIFHSNTVHYSEPNDSNNNRIGFIACYNDSLNPSVRRPPAHLNYDPNDFKEHPRVIEDHITRQDLEELNFKQHWLLK